MQFVASNVAIAFAKTPLTFSIVVAFLLNNTSERTGIMAFGGVSGHSVVCIRMPQIPESWLVMCSC